MNQEEIKFLDSIALDKRLNLIEQAFNYQRPHSFYVDFYPLFGSEFNNGHLCALYNEEVVGHLAYCQREIIISNKHYKVVFLGGIAVAKEYRGLGIFKTLMQKAIALLENEAHFFMLWSGDAGMYEPFDFQECGAIYQWGELESNLPTRSLSTLSHTELMHIKELYELSWPNRIMRDEQQWQALLKMKSVQVHFSNDSYAFIGKGFDLGGVMHEYGSRDLKQFELEQKSFRVWSPHSSGNKNELKLWLALARKGNKWTSAQDISQFINENKILIGGVDSI